MKRTATLVTILLGAGLLAAPLPPQGEQATLRLRNPIDVARPSESIVLTAADVARLLKVDDLRNLHVRDSQTGAELLVQAIDVNDDGRFEEALFQSDFAPGETRSFALSSGPRVVYTRDQFRAYGRFVRERRDDFAWENDRIAHRMYGAALETWAQEPLTSSAVDVWMKRTRRLVINDWYMVDDYHRDHGEGADFYSAGKSRGCGGNAIWEGGTLYPSANFVGTRLLANGPIRVMFELTYPAWPVNGRTVREVKRVTLDAGQNLGRFESRYETSPGAPLEHAVGVKKQGDSAASQARELGILRTWESVKDNGHLGCGIVVDPAQVTGFAEADGNYLVAAKVPAGGAAVYYAGFAWDRSGDVAGVEGWDAYLAQFARRLRAPLVVVGQ